MISDFSDTIRYMKSGGYFYFGIIIGSLVLTLIAYSWFMGTPYFAQLTAWSQQNLIIFCIGLVLIKIIGIIWPPLPGGIITLGAVPIIGWVNAFAADFVGSIIGASLAYYIGKHYGYSLLRKILHDDIVAKLQAIKIKKNKEIESTITLRIIGGGPLMEAVCYGAGLLGIHYHNSLIGMIVSHLLISIPGFYFAEQVLERQNIFGTIVSAIIFIFLMRKFKDRYLE